METEVKNIPELVMLVGIPASGKSTTTEKYADVGHLILSSDEIRLSLLENKEVLPNDPKQLGQINVTVFEMIKKQAVAAIRSGRSVVLDATNLGRRKRISFLSNFTRVACYKKCVLFITPREVCFERNALRKGIARVPDEAMEQMLKNFESPAYQEGWDEIEPVVYESPYHFPFAETVDFSQDNPYHSLTLYEHLRAAVAYATDNGYPPYLREVAYYHDIGKLYTKSFTNMKGEVTEHAHFYGHENYSAYLYLTEKCCGKTFDEMYWKQILYNANLINCHMRPLTVWFGNSAMRTKDILLFGERFVEEIEAINKADRFAH